MSSARTGKERLWPLRHRVQSSFCVLTIAVAYGVGLAHAETVAGTVITNTATASFSQDGKDVSTSSNPVSTPVSERLDVSVAALVPRTAIDRDAAISAVGFRVTNTGNGAEAFRLDANIDQPAATVKGFALDTDNNGIYDPAVDTLLDEAVTPKLAAGAAQGIFVLVANAAAAGVDIAVSAGATAVTGSGAPGTVFPARGDGGVDAVVGKTGADARAQALLTPTATVPTLAKAQSVVAPDGSTRAVRGATITYTLTAHFNGRTPGAVIADPIPQGTGYVAGSLMLDGGRLSDGADADAGTFDGSRISVALGDVGDAGDHVITFKTIIQ